MTILITGGAGFIGSHLSLLLADRGIEAVIVDNLSSGFRNLVPRDFTFLNGDLSNVNFLQKLFNMFQFDTIFHFAAKTVVPDSFQNPLEYYQQNYSNSLTLIDHAVRSGVKYFIFSSTAALYGNKNFGLVDENAALDPISPYGRSKLAVEWALRDVSAAQGLKFVAFRYFNVAGADPTCRSGQSDPRATHLIKVAVRAALGLNSGLTVFGTDYATSDGTCIRDYVHVSDLAAAHFLGLRHLKSGGGNLVVNCGYGSGFSVLDVIRSVKNVSGNDFPIKFAERRIGDPVSLIADGKIARRVLGWQPMFNDLDTIVEHSINWERKLLNL